MISRKAIHNSCVLIALFMGVVNCSDIPITENHSPQPALNNKSIKRLTPNAKTVDPVTEDAADSQGTKTNTVKDATLEDPNRLANEINNALHDDKTLLDEPESDAHWKNTNDANRLLTTLARNKATRKTFLEDIERAYDRIQEKDFNRDNTSGDISKFKDYILYLFQIMTDFRNEGNYLLLTKEMLASQRFYNLLRRFQIVYNSDIKDPLHHFSLTPEDFISDINKVAFDAFRMGNEKSLIEGTFAKPIRVAIDANSTFLVADTRVAIRSVDIPTGRIFFEGLTIAHKDFDGVLQHLRWSEDGSARLQIKDSSGNFHDYNIVGEDFFFYFIWLFFRFETPNPSVHNRLETAAEESPLPEVELTVSEFLGALENEADEVILTISTCRFLIENDSHLNLRLAFFKNNPIADYRRFYQQFVVKNAKRFDFIDHLEAIDTLFIGQPKEADSHYNNSFGITLNHPISLIQEETRIDIDNAVFVQLTDTDKNLNISGISGKTAAFIVTADLSFNHLLIDREKNGLFLHIDADVKLPFFRTKRVENRWFNFIDPVTVVDRTTEAP